MGAQEHRPGITWKALAATEEGSLSLPGSTLVDEEHHDEGEGWGFDASLLSAMLFRSYGVNAQPNEIMSWFEEQLMMRGWTPQGGEPFKPGAFIGYSSYSWDRRDFFLRVFGRAEERPPWTYWRSSWNALGTHYDITLSETSADDA
jgi:hypothetical protein